MPVDGWFKNGEQNSYLDEGPAQQQRGTKYNEQSKTIKSYHQVSKRFERPSKDLQDCVAGFNHGSLCVSDTAKESRIKR